MDVPAGVTQEEGNTGFSIHLLSAVLALIFLARRIQPFLSLVDREVEFCVLRPFLTRKFFQEILGLEGSKFSWEKKHVSYEEIFRQNFLARKFWLGFS